MKYERLFETLVAAFGLVLTLSSVGYTSGTENGNAGSATEEKQDVKRDEQREERREERREKLKLKLKKRKVPSPTSSEGHNDADKTDPQAEK